MHVPATYADTKQVPPDGGWADGGWHAIRPTSVIVPVASGINKRFEMVTVPVGPMMKEVEPEEKFEESEHKETDVEKRVSSRIQFKCITSYWAHG